MNGILGNLLKPPQGAFEFWNASMSDTFYFVFIEYIEECKEDETEKGKVIDVETSCKYRNTYLWGQLELECVGG